MADCPFYSAAEDIADFIYRRGSLRQISGSPADIPCLDHVNDEFDIIYTPLDTVTPISLARYSYYSIPGLFSLLDSSSMEASGILSAFSAPALDNQGRGTLIGIVDTGIDYANPLFRYSDGSTRIAGIWDQTIEPGFLQDPPSSPGAVPAPALSVSSETPPFSYAPIASYGTEFTREQIDQALALKDPLSLVPSQDKDGHGTFLAGIAAGSYLPEQDFTGAAPQCELAVVKLKEAKSYLKEFYMIPQSAKAYQENDIMMGIKYLQAMADRFNRPLVLLIALGSNLGSHEGSAPLSGVIQDATRFLGRAAVVAAGNETGLAHHYFGRLPSGKEWEDVELKVGTEESEGGFSAELWAPATDVYSVGFVSPSGEIISRIPIIARNETTIPFLLESTVITVNFQLIESGAGRQLIFMRFRRPAPGIWKIRVYNSLYFTGDFHMWLPSHGLISEDTVFLRPSPDTTITLPGNSSSPITVAAYDHTNGSIYIHSSRGFTPSGLIKPELAAPGVNILGPSVKRPIDSQIPMTVRSGTSVAAAHVAGAAANLFSWGIVEGNQITMSQSAVKAHLIRGAKRNPALRYPNEEWGYGALDLYQAFLSIRE